VIICSIGLAEVFNSIGRVELVAAKIRLRDLFLTWDEWVASRWAILRGGFIGFFVGLIPREEITTAHSRLSPRSASPTSGGLEAGPSGVASPEAANNSASISGSLLLALGIRDLPRQP
jgi:putative tricarboxylic transport membrane protein